MVYLKKTNEIVLPKHYFYQNEKYTLTLSNGLTTLTLFEDKEDLSVEKMYYTFILDNELTMEVGEYDYNLRSENVNENGIIVYGEFTSRKPQTITKIDNKNIQFNGKRR